jgi:hypothetical protein
MLRKIAISLAVAFMAAVADAGTTPAAAHQLIPSGPAHRVGTERGYTFRTLDNPADPAYNVLTGINDAGVIGGYYGVGIGSDTSHGYTVAPPYGVSNYAAEDFPGSTLTQVFGIDNLGDTAGVYHDAAGKSHGFVDWNGAFTSLHESPRGLNNAGWTVWTAARGNGGEFTRVYLLNARSGRRKAITAWYGGGDHTGGTGLNDSNHVVGWTKLFGSSTAGWALIDGRFYPISLGSGSEPSTVASGINNHDEVVGTYCESYCAQTHGFVLTGLKKTQKYVTVDDPSGVGSTEINAVNDEGQLVGTYVDASGNTNAFLATPR